MNTSTILDLIAAREAATSAARDDLREQMTRLASELAAIECELSDLAMSSLTEFPSPQLTRFPTLSPSEIIFGSAWTW